jgi:DNA repair exonuclease SbcCD nuclease subunit
MSVRSRLDQSTQVGLDKLQWILALAEANNISTVICGGDFFHIHTQQVYFMNRVIQLIKAYKQKGITLYTVAGNHDLAAGSYDTLWTSAIGVLTNTDLVSLLGDLALEDGWLLRGISAYQKLNLDDAAKVLYLVVHGSVNETVGDKAGVVEGFPVAGGMYYLSSQLKKFYPNLKGILHGHLHHETLVTKSLEGIWMINPGSMLRVSSAEENRRIPKIAYIDTLNEAFQLHPIAIAQPYESIFNLEVKIIRKSVDFEVSRFVSMIATSMSSGININSIISDMLKSLPEDDQLLIKADLVTQGFSLDDLAA